MLSEFSAGTTFPQSPLPISVVHISALSHRSSWSDALWRPAWDGAHEAPRFHVTPIPFVAEDSRRLIVTSKATISILEQLLVGTESKCRLKVNPNAHKRESGGPSGFYAFVDRSQGMRIGLVDRVKRSGLGRRLLSRSGQTYVV
jgi:hypothetical protein